MYVQQTEHKSRRAGIVDKSSAGASVDAVELGGGKSTKSSNEAKISAGEGIR